MRLKFALALMLLTPISRMNAQSTRGVDSRVDGRVDRDVDSSAGRRRLQPLPAVGSAPETGFQFGATMLGVWERPRSLHSRPASVLAYALRSAKAQTRIGVEGEYWTRSNNQRVASTLVWQQFPLPYYGIGDNALSTAKEIFTPRSVELTLSGQQRVRGSWYLTASARHLNQHLDFDSAGVLRQRTIVGTAGGAITEWAVGLQTDTRDNLFAPRSGRWIQTSLASSAVGAWSDYGYRKWRLDARRYQTLIGTHVLALHGQLTGVTGEAPFDQLALVGNSDILRGYEKGRYRDHWVGAAQAEYRSPSVHRIGGVLFAGAGFAAPSLRELSDRVLLPTYGAGLRVVIDPEQRTAVRVDYGRGRAGASGLYVGFNQAF